jgi:predicted protein tyrosine phosphatase
MLPSDPFAIKNALETEINQIEGHLSHETQRGPAVAENYISKLGSLLEWIVELREQAYEPLSIRVCGLIEKANALRSGKVPTEIDLKRFNNGYQYDNLVFQQALQTRDIPRRETLLKNASDEVCKFLDELEGFLPTRDIQTVKSSFGQLLVDLENASESSASPIAVQFSSQASASSSQPSLAQTASSSSRPVSEEPRIFLPTEAESLEKAFREVYLKSDRDGRTDLQILRNQLVDMEQTMVKNQKLGSLSSVYDLVGRGLTFLGNDILRSQTLHNHICNMEKFTSDIQETIRNVGSSLEMIISVEIAPGITEDMQVRDWLETFVETFLKRIEHRKNRLIVEYAQNQLDGIEKQIIQDESRGPRAGLRYQDELAKITHIITHNNILDSDRSVLLERVYSLTMKVKHLDSHQALEVSGSFFPSTSSSQPFIHSSSLPYIHSSSLASSSSNTSIFVPPLQGFTDERVAIRSLLQGSNEELQRIITNDQTILPQPVDNHYVMQDIVRWTPEYMVNVLEGREAAPTPLHFQAAQFIDAQNKCQETREHEIIPHVYVGNYDALRVIDPAQGSNPVGFTRVISVTRMDPRSGDEFSRANIPLSVRRVSVEVSDEDEAWNTLEENFEEFFSMIDQARANGENILIHCSQGQSRSVTVMIAYLINRCHVNPERALHYIRTKRFLAEPIPGLNARLIAYAHKLGVTCPNAAPGA